MRCTWSQDRVVRTDQSSVKTDQSVLQVLSGLSSCRFLPLGMAPASAPADRRERTEGWHLHGDHHRGWCKERSPEASPGYCGWWASSLLTAPGRPAHLGGKWACHGMLLHSWCPPHSPVCRSKLVQRKPSRALRSYHPVLRRIPEAVFIISGSLDTISDGVFMVPWGCLKI